MDAIKLKICFSVLVGERLYSEREVADRLPLFKALANDGVIDPGELDGAISVRYNGEELLGPDFWTLIPYGFGLLGTSKLLEGEVEENIYGHHAWLRLRIEGSHILYELNSHAPSPERRIRQKLPLKPFVQEWHLMEIRLDRFRDYLFGYDSLWLKDETFEWLQPFINLLDEDALRHVAKGELEQVLSLSGCCEGYRRYGHNKTFSPVL